jgi:hypothetical protein
MRLSAVLAAALVVASTSVTVSATETAAAGAEFDASVITVPVVSTGLFDWAEACDESRGVLWAAMSSQSERFAGSVVGVDPLTGRVIDVMPATPRTSALAVSGDGQFLFMADLGGTVRQVALASKTIVREFSIGQVVPTSVVPLPGQPGSVAVGGNSTFSSSITIYDDGLARPKTAFGNNISFDANETAAYAASGSTVLRFPITAAGFDAPTTAGNLPSDLPFRRTQAGRWVTSALVTEPDGSTWTLPSEVGLTSAGPTQPFGFVNTTIDPNAERAILFRSDSFSQRRFNSGRIIDLETRETLVKFRFSPSESLLADGIPRTVCRGSASINVLDFTTRSDGGRALSILRLGGLRGNYGEYTAVSPGRVLDTRNGIGRPAPGPIADASTIAVQITGREGVPRSGVTAVALNVTVANPTAVGYITLFPNGTEQPLASNLNFRAGQTVANFAVVPVGGDGKIAAFNSAGDSELIFDVAGYFSDVGGGQGGRFHAISPERYFDTRSGAGGFGRALGPNESRVMTATGRAGVPLGATAVVVNITATRSTTGTYVTAYPGEAQRPTASNVNLEVETTVPNLAIVRVDSNGSLRFYNYAGSVDLIADVIGYFDDDRSSEMGRYFPSDPFRLLDTRAIRPIHAKESFKLLSQNPVGGAMFNVTVVDPTQSGYATLYPASLDTPPNASNLNFVRGQTVPNLAIIRFDLILSQTYSSAVNVYNSAGDTHFIVDAFGSFT